MSLESTILSRIESIAAAEKITKKELALISREILEFIMLEGSQNVAIVNRLIAVLSPMNTKVACLFFPEFLPWKFDAKLRCFGKKMQGDKKLAEYSAKAVAFLEDESNNIWTWAESNIKVEKKVDYLKNITKNIKGAMESDDIAQADIIQAVIDGGIEINAVIAMLRAMPADGALVAAVTPEDNNQEVAEVPEGWAEVEAGAVDA